MGDQYQVLRLEVATLTGSSCPIQPAICEQLSRETARGTHFGMFTILWASSALRDFWAGGAMVLA